MRFKKKNMSKTERDTIVCPKNSFSVVEQKWDSG